MDTVENKMGGGNCSVLQPLGVLTTTRLLCFGVPFVGGTFFQTLSSSRSIDNKLVSAVRTVLISFFHTSFGPFDIITSGSRFGFRVPFVGGTTFQFSPGSGCGFN